MILCFLDNDKLLKDERCFLALMLIVSEFISRRTGLQSNKGILNYWLVVHKVPKGSFINFRFRKYQTFEPKDGRLLEQGFLKGLIG